MSENDNNEPQDNKDNEKEYEDFLKALEIIEKAAEENKKNKGKKPRNLIAIEFGGIFHHNMFINMAFNYLINFTLFYIIIESFGFAEFSSIYYLLGFILIYTIVEQLYKAYVLLHHFKIVLKSMGFVFYFGYVAMFYILDVYIFRSDFSFVNEVLLVVSVALFTIARYTLSTIIRKRLRYIR
ncbi:MAG: hypothetical protein QM489_02645 [Candidatus Izemoplasma sp.]